MHSSVAGILKVNWDTNRISVHNKRKVKKRGTNKKEKKRRKKKEPNTEK